jgi:chitin synthase
MAWREKLALCIIIFLMCGALMFFIIGFGPLICPREDAYSIFEVNLKKEMKDPWVYAYGKVYQVGELVGNHKSSYGIEEFTFFPSLGQDVSNLFFKTEKFSSYCPNLAEPSGWDNLINRPPPDKTRFPHKSAGKPYLENMNKYAKGRLLWTTKDVEKSSSSKKRLIIIGQNVYDVTSYFTANVKFLGPAVEQIFGTLYGKDATNAWMSLSRNDPKAPEYLKCMNAMFYIGAVDNRNSFKCQFSNYLLLTVSAMLLSVVCVKFLSSLQFGSEKLPEDYKKNVIIQVPCYTEGFESLSKTLESLAMTRYDNGSKLIFVICDGMIIGDGNDKPTPSIVLDILGNESTSNPNIFKYQSLGKGPLRQNCGKVYSGIFNHRGNHVPYIVVVKLGNGSEQVKPGNRGKRDSQLLLLRFLSRIHFQSDMSPLELEIFHHMKNILQKHPKLFEYLLMVDSDTTITENALNKLIATMVHDSKIAGLCGETLVDNEKQSWVTMIQVYEYFISHHLSKAFESLFGSVTCLPGCFCLYRIRTPKTRVPIIISPALLKDYSENNVRTLHMKNLLHLGEDRFLTTLVMKHFPGFKLKFDAEAKCLTNVPDRWSVLVSQRRRWINSTIHNLFELLSLQQLCGFCCLSMRFVVFLDLFSTMVQPAGVLYIVYLFYNIYASQEVFPVVSIIIVASIYGLQVIIFVLKRQWAQIGWMLVVFKFHLVYLGYSSFQLLHSGLFFLAF